MKLMFPPQRWLLGVGNRHSHTRPHTKKGSTFGFLLWCCQIEFLNMFWTRDPTLCTQPHNYVSCSVILSLNIDGLVTSDYWSMVEVTLGDDIQTQALFTDTLSLKNFSHKAKCPSALRPSCYESKLALAERPHKRDSDSIFREWCLAKPSCSNHHPMQPEERPWARTT